jgi:hypothetical protein
MGFEAPDRAFIDPQTVKDTYKMLSSLAYNRFEMENNGAISMKV